MKKRTGIALIIWRIIFSLVVLVLCYNQYSIYRHVESHCEMLQVLSYVIFQQGLEIQPDSTDYNEFQLINYSKEKSNCSFILKYENQVIAKGVNVDFDFQVTDSTNLYYRGNEDSDLKPMLTENSPDCIVSFHVDKHYWKLIENLFTLVDKPLYFYIETELYYPNVDFCLIGKGYLIEYYRGICTLEVLSGDVFTEITEE